MDRKTGCEEAVIFVLKILDTICLETGINHKLDEIESAVAILGLAPDCRG